MKYAEMLGTCNLRNFERKGPCLWNYACPICGDSEKKKYKTRGYLIKSGKTNGLFHFCHNCGCSSPFPKFLKSLNQDLYNKYLLEELELHGSTTKKVDFTNWQEKDLNKPISTFSLPKNLPCISDLEANHPARIYIEGRKIPKRFMGKLLYTEDFKQTVMETVIVQTPYIKLKEKEPRVIIPILDENGEFIGFQGRSLDKTSPMRYISINLSNKPLIYGLDRWNKNAEFTYVLEGPFDSMFLPNAVAMVGSNFESGLEKLLELGAKKRSIKVVFDNEPRSATNIKKMEHMLHRGYEIVIWPETISKKDINEMVVSGQTPEVIMETISKNSFYDLDGHLFLMSWRKCATINKSNNQRKGKPTF